MKRRIIFFIFLLSLFSCSTKKVTLKFLNEYVVKDSMKIEGTLIGGISGIDSYESEYIMVVDDAWSPRALVGDISVENGKIESVVFKQVIKFNDSTKAFYTDNALDLESVFIEETGNINLVSEGAIRSGKNPLIFSVNRLTDSIYKYKYPTYFKANSASKPKHNASFESSSKSYDGKGFWVAMEAPLGSDGEEPTFKETQSPVRITYFDNKTKKATKQFVFQLEKIEKPNKGKINLNGITAILEFKKNQFFVVERIYQSGYGSYGNVVRIFKATVNSKSTNTLAINSLKETNFIPLKKELVFDFESVKHKLTEQIVDNIEGITFGPKLANENQSLILVSDDNFQKYGKQLNQFILLEIIDK